MTYHSIETAEATTLDETLQTPMEKSSVMPSSNGAASNYQLLTDKPVLALPAVVSGNGHANEFALSASPVIAIPARLPKPVIETPKTTLPHIRLEPSKGWVPLRLSELWAYRELLIFFTWRDITVRYKQTVLGASWAIIQPFFTMVVFSLFFGRLAQIPSDGIPYPLFSFAALVPWTFFSNAITNSGMSLVTSRNLIKKVYFPRLIVPISSVSSGLVDFTLAFIVLMGMMLYFVVGAPTGLWTPNIVAHGLEANVAHIAFSLNMLWVIPLLLLAYVTALGTGLWLSAMNVQFRDVRYVIPFLVQFWMFATPIAYPSSLLPESLRIIYGLNPMAGVIEGFRWALLGTDTAPGPMILVSAVMAVVILVSGAFYFRRVEKSFADVV